MHFATAFDKLGAMHQVVATVGPASYGLVSRLVEAGATAFRLNASHLSAADLALHIREIRAEAPRLEIVVDLQGAKMRVGDGQARLVKTNEQLRFCLHADGDVHVPHPELFAAVSVGDTLKCDDDRLHFIVEHVEACVIKTRSLQDGVVSPRKGINLANHPVRLDGLTQTDRLHVEACQPFEDISFAVSFVCDGTEAAWVRALSPRRHLIAKIERREALDRVDDIYRAFDAVWICRGDLGAQLGPRDLARFIAAFRPPIDQVPTWIAGQVLEHLTHHARPTRSEICHLFDLMSRGYAGIVLSDESAVGIDPVNAVRVAVDLLKALR